MSKPAFDKDRQKVYDAEFAWRDQLSERRMTSIAEVRACAENYLPPCSRLAVGYDTFRKGTNRDRGQVSYDYNLRTYRLRVVLPALPSVILHEVAHILQGQARGWDTDPAHGLLFRRTYLFLVRWSYGNDRYYQLAESYAQKGLST